MAQMLGEIVYLMCFKAGATAAEKRVSLHRLASMASIHDIHTGGCGARASRASVHAIENYYKDRIAQQFAGEFNFEQGPEADMSHSNKLND